MCFQEIESTFKNIVIGSKLLSGGNFHMVSIFDL